MDIERKYNSKAHRFFEWLFMLVFVNIMTILLLIPIITILPAITAMYATIKDSITEGPNKPIRMYFSNFMKYSEKSFIMELVIGIILVIAGISMWYYYGKIAPGELLSNIGFWIMFIFIVIIVIMVLHIPLLIVTFKTLRTKELLKTSMFIAFRYIGITLIALVLFVISIVGIVAAPIWFLVGLSGPAFLVIKVCEPLYYRLNKIDFEKIMRQVDEEEEENE
ncbi:MAG: DUF624 domain-containing protein [Bacilli bacterium]|nr:DUF624 domain-containing protein [Bacilli bacterium]